VTIRVDPSLDQESKCVNQFDARIVLAQNVKSIPSTTTVAFAINFNSIVDKKLNNIIQIFFRVLSAQNMKRVPSAVVFAVNFYAIVDKKLNDVN
jgi:hypothetical protein